MLYVHKVHDIFTRAELTVQTDTSAAIEYLRNGKLIDRSTLSGTEKLQYDEGIAAFKSAVNNGTALYENGYELIINIIIQPGRADQITIRRKAKRVRS